MPKSTQSDISLENSWAEKKFAVLLESASIAIKRARYVFIIINIGAILIFSAEFNALFPWIRWPIDRKSTPPEAKEILINVLHRDLEIFSVPLLGIRVSVADLNIIGSLAMLILAIWFFYCVRRENLVVSDIYKLARTNNNPHIKSYLYYGIAHYFVYTTATRKEYPAGSIESPSITARRVVKVLFYVPCWAPLLIVVSDALSLLMKSKIVSGNPCPTLWCLFESKLEAGEAIGRMAIAIFIGVVAWSQCSSAYKWDAGTRSLVEALRLQVEKDEKPS